MEKKIMLISCICFIVLLFSSTIVYGQKQIEKDNTESALNAFFFCVPTIQFWDDDEASAFLAPAQWTEILVAQDCTNDGPLFSNLNEEFNEFEVLNFRVLLENSGIQEDEVFVNLKSLSENGEEVDRISSLRLSQNNSDGRFFSDYILIVIDKDEIDDDFEESAFVNPDWDGIDDGEGDVTIYGEVGGKIEVTLISNNIEAENEMSICPEEAIRTVSVKVHVLKNPMTDEPFVDNEIIDAQLNMAKRVLSQACIKLVVDGPYNNFSSNLPVADINDGIKIFDSMEGEEVKSIIGQVKDISNQKKIDLIFLNEFENDSGTNGISLADLLWFDGSTYDGNENHKRTCLISGKNLVTSDTRPFLVGHEMGHVLSNHPHYLAESYNIGSDGCVNINNLGYPDIDFTDPNVDQNNTLIFNLMRSGTSMQNEFFGSKRLRSFQINLFRTETDIPQQ